VSSAGVLITPFQIREHIVYNIVLDAEYIRFYRAFLTTSISISTITFLLFILLLLFSFGICDRPSTAVTVSNGIMIWSFGSILMPFGPAVKATHSAARHNLSLLFIYLFLENII
jgi:hypothetical protein